MDANIPLGKPILPGEKFLAPDTSELTKSVVVGPGITLSTKEISDTVECQESLSFQAYTAGVLNRSIQDENVFYVNSVASFQYEPAVGDNVVGLIVGRTIDYYRVAIRGRETAFLGQLAFEGATKRNRPDVQIGDVVFARVSSTAPGVCGKQCELVCVSPDSDKAEGMGVLRDPSVANQSNSNGIVFTVASARAIQRLVSKNNKLLKEIGKRIPFESAYGYNGVVWVRGRSVRETILVANLIQAMCSMNSLNKESMNQLIDVAMQKLAACQ